MPKISLSRCNNPPGQRHAGTTAVCLGRYRPKQAPARRKPSSSISCLISGLLDSRSTVSEPQQGSLASGNSLVWSKFGWLEHYSLISVKNGQWLHLVGSWSGRLIRPDLNHVLLHHVTVRTLPSLRLRYPQCKCKCVWGAAAYLCWT